MNHEHGALTMDDRRTGAALLRAGLTGDQAGYEALVGMLDDQRLHDALSCAVGCAVHLLASDPNALDRLDDILTGAAMRDGEATP